MSRELSFANGSCSSAAHSETEAYIFYISLFVLNFENVLLILTGCSASIFSSFS